MAILLLSLASCRPAKEAPEQRTPEKERYIPVESNAVNMLYAPEIYIPENRELEKKEEKK